ncbi:hypothetical protein P7K49_032245 [Saguinus oedipus]|uniref:ATP synthase peripheral stalk subunit OSCP, mitochondrial n=1 Tax=Saguinus oedipus TaxID=9490 RepID=A0ABQ9TXQ9_SAGOE|nr:hypothetical protein P7K49_032245 [Saguinus oedipus]
MAAPAVSGLSRQVYGVEGRYATALYSAASKQKKLEQVEKELLRVANEKEVVSRDGCAPVFLSTLPLRLFGVAVAASEVSQNLLGSLELCKRHSHSAGTQILKEPKVAASVLNPYVKHSIKVKSLSDIIAKERFSPLTTNLITNVIICNLNVKIRLQAEYKKSVADPYGLLEKRLEPLEEATLSELKAVLKSFLSQGQILKLEVKTDPSIMGGMIVRIGEKYIDMSAKTKIQKLSKAMREVI